MTDWYINKATCPSWLASTTYGLGARVWGSAAANHDRWAYSYECTTAGTSGTGVPNWNASAGATTTDGSVVWTARRPWTWIDAHGSVQYLIAANFGGAVGSSDRIFFRNTHIEDYGATLDFPNYGTNFTSPPQQWISTDSVAEPPTTYTYGATIRVVGNINFRSSIEGYGMQWITGHTMTSAADFSLHSGWNHSVRMVGCRYRLASTDGGSRIRFGELGSQNNQFARYRVEGCTFSFNATGQRLGIARQLLDITDCVVDPAGVIPTTLMEFGGNGASATISGCDFSPVTGVLADAGGCWGGVVIRNCKLGTATLTSVAPPMPMPFIVDNCDIGDTNYKMYRQNLVGSIVTETTRVRTGGASDGSTTISWRMATTGTINARYNNLRTPAIVAWNETVGSPKTVAVEILHDSTTALTNTEAWLEVECLTTVNASRSSMTSGALLGFLSIGTNHPPSSETWTTTGMANPNKQRLLVSVTPQEKGPILVWVCLVKSSYTIYVDPKLTIA